MNHTEGSIKEPHDSLDDFVILSVVRVKDDGRFNLLVVREVNRGNTL